MKIDKLAEGDRRARVKRAELAGGIGAGALGMGLGTLLTSYLRNAGATLVFAGIALHAMGMWDKHRLERSLGEESLWWETALYWICWASLAGVFVYAFVRPHA